MLTLETFDPLAVELASRIRQGDLAELGRLLADHPDLATARIRDRKGGERTALHVVTDWPGYFPEGPAVVRVLVAGGADPSAPMLGGKFAETPLHWAASSDDAEVAEALIDLGADLEAADGSIAQGTPLTNAVGYGCWHVARLLVSRGARVDDLWIAAALGMRSRVDELLARAAPATGDELSHALWQATHGGQRRMVEYLAALGADVNWTPDYAPDTPLDIAMMADTRREAVATWLRENGGHPAAAAKEVAQ
jgi:hypothetical protein